MPNFAVVLFLPWYYRDFLPLQKLLPMNIQDRFLNYVSIFTTSDESNKDCPSTKRQFDLANLLVDELNNLGLQEISLDENGYLMATLPSNIAHEIPTIGFIAHMDTSPDFNGQNVNPQIIKNYHGQKIILNQAKNMVLSPDYFPELNDYLGQTIITTDGNSLLGADDKAGIAAIVSAMDYLIAHLEIEHGKIRIGFTPDEEIGRGAKLFDVEKFGAAWAYTIDGGGIGELEYENFNAASAKVEIKGKSVHPGYAYGKMVNASLVAQEFIKALPSKETPSTTQGYEGFYHLTKMSGDVSTAHLEYIIRDHDIEKFLRRKETFKEVTKKINKTYGEEIISVTIEDQYFNMKEKIEPVIHIVDIAEKAMVMAEIKPIRKPIRGGTDGAQLSFKGLPCPNIFTGGHNFHGPYEYIPLESMVKATEVVVNICKSLVSKGL